MKTLTRVLSPLMVVALASAGCDRVSNRWATTENTNVKIDFDKVNEAYKLAEGPEDFERRVNEIYEGDELVSVAVQDLDAKVQVVTGFFDHDTDGKPAEAEKIFTIRREVKGEGEAQMQTTGLGHYGYYHSPFLSIMSGMMVGSMISNAMRPSYVPMYGTPYTTSLARADNLRSHRQTYRDANPSRFNRAKASGSGRNYNSTGSSRPSRPSGGTRFGVRRRDRKSVRIEA